MFVIRYHSVLPFRYSLLRVMNAASIIKETVFQSKQMGRRENKSINIEFR